MSLTRLYWMHALTPLHVGTGKALGTVDLPIAREKVTNWPMVPASAVKGVLSSHHDATLVSNRKSDALKRAAFGFVSDDDTDGNAGALNFTDAAIVCFPTRSMYGTFVWVTSPLVLTRLNRHMKLAGLQTIAVPPSPDDGSGLCSSLEEITVERSRGHTAFLEDLDLTLRKDDQASAWATFISQNAFQSDADWAQIFRHRFVIVNDKSFDFLVDTATEVQAHIKIDQDRKSVVRGALWYEESLPAESILAGLAMVRPIGSSAVGVKPDDIASTFLCGKKCLQFGGNATVGKGQTDLIFTEGGVT